MRLIKKKKKRKKDREREERKEVESERAEKGRKRRRGREGRGGKERSSWFQKAVSQPWQFQAHCPNLSTIPRLHEFWMTLRALPRGLKVYISSFARGT